MKPYSIARRHAHRRPARHPARRTLTLALRLSLPALLLYPLCTPRDALAVGEQYGRISGVLTEAASKIPIPGVLVKATSKALIGGAQTVLTAEDGSYTLDALPNGTYDLEFTVEGAKPLRRRVVVRQGETTPLNIAWSVEETNATVVQVVEERHMTKPDNTQTGTVLTADTQARVATPRTYQAIVQQVAGVTGGSNPNVKGAMFQHNRYLVDGMDITDPVSSTFSANINFDSIASVEMMTGGMEAQYNSLGGILNLVTAAGSNEFKIDSSLYVNNQYFSLGQQFGPQIQNGVRPFLIADRPPSQSYQANINLSGPIVKNRLWFNASFEYYYRENATPIGPPLNVQHPPAYSHRYLARLKLTWSPSEKHRITLSASADPASFHNTNGDNTSLSVAENHQNQGGVFSILQWDYFINQNRSFNLQTGFQWSRLYGGPQGQYGSIDGLNYYQGDPRFSRFGNRNWTYEAERPAHYNADDNTSWYQGGTVFDDSRYTFQFDPTFSLRGKALGSHEAKFGLQSRFVYHAQSYHTPGGTSYTDSGGGDGEAGICDYDRSLGVANPTGVGCYQRTDTPDWNNAQYGWSIGGFVQDRWKIRPWLQINPGLRLDYGFSKNSRGETVSNMWGFGPRLGAVVDLTRDQKTIFSVYYGRANEVMNLVAGSSADVVGVSTTYQFNPDKMGADKWDKWDKLFSSGGPGGYRLGTNLTPPHTDEVTVSLRRELFPNSAASIDYTYKRMSNIWDNVEVNQIWDPTGQRVIGYANSKPEQILLYTTPDWNYRNYHGVDLSLESRPRQEWDFYVAYTLSFTYGPGLEQLGWRDDFRSTSGYNPRLFQFYDGWLPEDQRHTLKVRASYNWKGLNIGAFMTYSTGKPLTKRFFSQYDGAYTYRRSPTGIDPQSPANTVGNFAEFRVPDVFNLDVRVAYDFHGLIRQHITVIADLFNAFNLGTVTGIYSSDGSNFGKVSARQTPFRAQLGVRYQF